MKSIIYCLLLLSLPAVAQKIKIDENTIVKDSSGFVYPYIVWQPILQKGTHTLKPEKPGDPQTAYIIVRLSEDEQDTRFAKMGKPRESSSFKTGKKEVLFNTTDINGKKLNLKDLQGKIIVMNFWFINCKPCRMEIPDLNELVARYAGSDKVLFVAVGLDQQHEIKDFIKQTPFNYNLVDNGRFFAQKYNIQGFPTHVIFDSEGKVYFHTIGLASNTVYWLRKSIDELLAKENKVAAN